MQIAVKPLPFETLLKLGRVSNLPTVWTDVLAGTVLAGGAVRSWQFGLLLLAMSLFYVGGMYLNDYFDRTIDARERPKRPIPAGDIAATTVLTIGFGLLGLGLALTAAAGAPAALIGALLAAVIVLYDTYHKGNPYAPLIMGLCRALLYAGAAAATGEIPAGIAIPALALLAYVAGLTYAAQQENLDRIGHLWPLLLLAAPMLLTLPLLAAGSLPALIYLALIASTAYAVYLLAARPMAGAVSRAVGILIAGISLVDAAMLCGVDAPEPALALVAVLGFPATLFLQKYIPGT